MGGNMKRINKYILEKLHINKDVKVINEIDNMSIKEFMKYLDCKDVSFNKIGTYHADKKIAEVYKIPKDIKLTLDEFCKKTIYISDIKEIGDICKEMNININKLQLYKYTNEDEHYFKINIKDIGYRTLFHVSFEKDIWWVQDYKDLDDDKVNKYINLFKKIIIYIIDNYKL